MVYRLTVAATDSDGRMTRTGVWVHLGPGVGAVSSASLPRFKRALEHRSIVVSVLEGVPTGFVIASLTTYLEPSAALLSPHAFELVEADSFGLFGVTSDDGLLVTLRNIDRETQGDLHRLVVAVAGTDGFPAQMNRTVNLEVFHSINFANNLCFCCNFVRLFTFLCRSASFVCFSIY